MKIFATIILLSVVVLVKAQDKTLMFLDAVPQSSYLNPAFIPDYTRYVGIPIMSATSFSANSSTFSLLDVASTKKGIKGDSLIFDSNRILDNLKTNNNVRMDANVDILSFGFMRKKVYWSFNMSLKSFGNVFYPKSLETFKNGNVDLATMTAKDIILNDVDANVYLYYETGFAVSYPINDNLRVGGRFKLLSGVSAVKTAQFSSSVKTSSDFKTSTVEAHASVYASSKSLEFETDEKGFVTGVSLSGNIMRFPYLTNLGMAVDLGIEAKPLRNFRVFGSLVDLGFISWKSDCSKIYTDGSYAFNGANLTPDKNGNIDFDRAVKDVVDTLRNKFKVEQGEATFSSGLFTKLYAGCEYQFNGWLKGGFLLKGAVYDKVIDPAIVISAKATPVPNFSGLLSLSYYNKTLNNVGVGVVVGSSPVQFYLAADNILSHFIKNNTDQSFYSSLPIPSRTRSVNVQLGVNILFGERSYKLPWRWKVFEQGRGRKK